jgi:phosphoglycolate phosphatase
MKTGLLFDLDGTLLDTLADLTDATNHTLRHFGCPERSMAEMRQIVGNGALRQMTLSLPGNADDPDVQQVLSFYKDYYNSHCRIKTRPYGEIPEVLAELAKTYPIAVVSNKPDSAVKPLCEEYFPGFYALGESAACPRKPAPDMVYKAMQAIGVEKCIYVGDSEVDIRTAKNAGVSCLSVLWGFRDRDILEGEGGTHFCAEPAEMAGMLEDLAKNPDALH